MDKVANPARGQLNRGKCPLFPYAPENLVSRDGFSRPVSFSILRLNLVLTHGIPPDFRGGVHLFI